MLYAAPLLVTFLSAFAVLAQSPCSTSIGISNPAAVIRKFKRAKIAPGVITPNAIAPTLQVDVTYGEKAVKLGNTFAVSETTSEPEISFTREEAFPPGRNYTVMMLDPDAPMPNDPPTTPAALSFFLHLLETNVHPTCAKKFAGTEDTIASYMAPTPLSVAKHRYIFLVWRQPRGEISFTTQPAFVGRNNFNLTQFVEETGIELVGGNYYLEGLSNVA